MDKKVSKGGFTQRKRKELIFYIAMLAFPVAQVIIFYFVVNFNSIFLAFKNYDYGLTTGAAGYTWASFSNFSKAITDLFNEYSLTSALKNTSVAFLIQLFICTPLALLFSYYIFKKRFGSGLFRIFLFLPSIISPLVIVILYKVILNECIPAMASQFFGKTILPIYSSNVMPSVLFYYVWTSFGTNVLLYTSTMTGIDQSLMEAAELDGATGIKGFIHIVFPMVYPTFVTFVVVIIAGFFTNQFNLFSFENASAEKQYYTYGYYLYVKTATGTIADYPYLSALGLIFTLITVPATLTARKLLTKFGPSVE